jgi:hypothetical protein
MMRVQRSGRIVSGAVIWIAGGMEMETIRIGSPVFTSGGDKIGTVKEVSGDFFHIDVSGQPDFWLNGTDILKSDVDRITMRFDKDHLGDFKADRPTVRTF